MNLTGFISENTPIIIKEVHDGIEYIDIVPISDVLNLNNIYKQTIDTSNFCFQNCKVDNDVFVWADNEWTKILHISAYPNLIDNKYPKLIETQKSIFMITNSHKVILDNNNEKKIYDLNMNDHIKLINYPLNILDTIESIDAFLYGVVCRIGCISDQIYNELTYEKLNDVWEIYCKNKNINYSRFSSLIEFYNKFNLHVNTSIFYDSHGKKIPKIILNSSDNIIKKFLEGLLLQFNNNDITILKIPLISKCQTLISGICYLLERLNIDFVLESEFRDIGLSYAININYIQKKSKENKIKKITPFYEYKGWLYNLTTESQMYSCGIGKCLIRN